MELSNYFSLLVKNLFDIIRQMKVPVVILLFVLTVFLSNVSLYGKSGDCMPVEKFLSNLENRDFLNYSVDNGLENYFWGQKKKEKLGDFIVLLSWSWNKLDVDSPIVKDTEIVSCSQDEGFIKAEVQFYFSYILFLRKKIDMVLKFKEIDNNWYLEPPDYKNNPLR